MLFRFTTTDTDSWFKTRELQHEDLKKQMETLQKDIVSMKQQKMTLFVSTTAFRRNLLDLLGKQTNTNNLGGNVIEFLFNFQDPRRKGK